MIGTQNGANGDAGRLLHNKEPKDFSAALKEHLTKPLKGGKSAEEHLLTWFQNFAVNGTDAQKKWAMEVYVKICTLLQKTICTHTPPVHTLKMPKINIPKTKSA